MARIIHTQTAQVEIVESDRTVDDVILEKMRQHEEDGIEDAFFVIDLADVLRKHKKWMTLFPRIKPYYAVKCHDNLPVMELLASLGAGFDCASRNEITKVLSLGVSPNRIIYANPCKQKNMIQYANHVGVDLMTFDNEVELQKVKAIFPDARLVLRILAPKTEKVQSQLGNKFGCLPADVKPLLVKAKSLGLNVVGISYHVGSGCYELAVYAAAVELAARAFETAKEVGYDFTILDVGGGFPGNSKARITVEEIAEIMTPALNAYFPEGCGVDIISEPGRYFVASAMTLTTQVIGKRAVARDPDGLLEPTIKNEPSYMYYINDGVYGSFNCIMFDHVAPEPVLLKEHDTSSQFTSTIFGPTCDSIDLIIKDHLIPELHVGDWVTFRDMGAYTVAAGSQFNGMPPPRMYYVSTQLQQDGECELDNSELLPSIMKSGYTLKEVPAAQATVLASEIFPGVPEC